MTEVSTDHGSVLPPNSSALVVSEDGEISFFMAGDPEAPVPRLVQLLAAVLLRSSDEEWVDEMLSVFEDQSSN